VKNSEQLEPRRAVGVERMRNGRLDLYYFVVKALSPLLLKVLLHRMRVCHEFQFLELFRDLDWDVRLGVVCPFLEVLYHQAFKDPFVVLVDHLNK